MKIIFSFIYFDQYIFIIDISFKNIFSFLYFIILESNKTTLLSSPSTYTNKKLQQIIDENKSKSNVSLKGNLTNEDMEIVANYLLRNNTVMNILFIFYS
jgi:hypothetical protein